MYGILIVLHVLISVALILVVLMQSGKGGGIGAAFGGGGGSQTLFGGTGAATFLHKATVGLAFAFMLSSLVLAVIGSRGGGRARSVLDETTAGQIPVQPQTLPAPAGDVGLPGVDEGVAPTEGGAELPGTEAEGIQIPLTEPGEDAGTGTETPGTTEPESPDEGGGRP
jgi:preprotein translocase subunit SecG